MPRTKLFGGKLAAVAVPLAFLSVTPALAAQEARSEKDRGELTTDGRSAAPGQSERRSRSSFSGQDGLNGAHLPPAKENVELISKFEPTSQGEIVPGQIADLAVFKGFAYLNSWADPTCTKGGFYVVDIRDPAKPREVAFRRARGGTYHGEGAHVISVANPTFTGDLLAVNNEPCDASNPEATGGFDLYDVSDPTNPVALAIGAGDKTDGDSAEETLPAANSAHSVFLWSAGGKTYAVSVDNTEFTDVDVYDVTDPRVPRRVGEYDLLALFPEIRANSANGDSIFLHDMVVKEIGGRQIMLASYWDSGYVQLDVTDPANPTLVTDTDFMDTDPLTGIAPPEGNAHQGEYSHDNRYILAADEDFSTYRLPKFEITTGPDAGQYPAGEFGFSRPIATLEDGALNGPTVFGGYGCDADNEIPARDSVTLTLDRTEEAILVLERGPVADPRADYPGCTFQEKVDNATAAGWDAVIIANHHTGAEGGDAPDAALCGSGTSGEIPAVCTGHRALHILFGREPGYDYETSDEPEVGDLGEEIFTESQFDGWGYAHLYDAKTSQEIDSYAIPEALDERYAFGFGDLSIHEWATDPETNLAYSSYYAGGFRTVSFGPGGIKEEGKFIDEGGNNFWGVEQFTDAAGNRLIALSDRDLGLYVVKYTGPGAVLAKPPAEPAAGQPEQPGQPTQPGQPGQPGQPNQPAQPNPGTGTPATPAGPSVAISKRALRLDRKGVARVRVGCPAAAKGSCTGVLRLASGNRRLGTRRFTIAAGQTEAVNVRFTSAGRRALRTRKSMRVQVIADAKDSAGARVSDTARITVRPVSAKAPSSRPR